MNLCFSTLTLLGLQYLRMSISSCATLGWCVTSNLCVHDGGLQAGSTAAQSKDTHLCHAWFTWEARKMLTWGSGDPRNLLHVCLMNCELCVAPGNRHIRRCERHLAGWSRCAEEVEHKWACSWTLPAHSALGSTGDDLFLQVSLVFIFLLSCFGNYWHWGTSSKIKRLPVSNIQWFLFSEKTPS